MRFNFSISNGVFSKCAIQLTLFQANVNAANNYPAHVGDSPVSYDYIAEPNGEFVVSDRQSGILDRYISR